MHISLRIAPLMFSWSFGSVNQSGKQKLEFKFLLTAYRFEYTEKHSDPETLGPTSPPSNFSSNHFLRSGMCSAKWLLVSEWSKLKSSQWQQHFSHNVCVSLCVRPPLSPTMWATTGYSVTSTVHPAPQEMGIPFLPGHPTCPPPTETSTSACTQPSTAAPLQCLLGRHMLVTQHEPLERGFGVYHVSLQILT